MPGQVRGGGGRRGGSCVENCAWPPGPHSRARASLIPGTALERGGGKGPLQGREPARGGAPRGAQGAQSFRPPVLEPHAGPLYPSSLGTALNAPPGREAEGGKRPEPSGEESPLPPSKPRCGQEAPGSDQPGVVAGTGAGGRARPACVQEGSCNAGTLTSGALAPAAHRPGAPKCPRASALRSHPQQVSGRTTAPLSSHPRPQANPTPTGLS